MFPQRAGPDLSGLRYLEEWRRLAGRLAEDLTEIQLFFSPVLESTKADRMESRRSSHFFFSVFLRAVVIQR